MKFTEGDTTRGWGDLPFCFSQVLPPVQFARAIMTQPPGGSSKNFPLSRGVRGVVAKPSPFLAGFYSGFPLARE